MWLRSILSIFLLTTITECLINTYSFNIHKIEKIWANLIYDQEFGFFLTDSRHYWHLKSTCFPHSYMAPLWMEQVCLSSRNLVIYNLLCYLPVKRASFPKRDSHQCLCTPCVLRTEDAGLWREYFKTDKLHDRCTKNNLLVCGLMWCWSTWSPGPNSFDLFAFQELPVLSVLLILGEFSTHIVFYMSTYVGSLCFLFCTSHTLYRRVFFWRMSHYQILNWLVLIS